MTWRMEKMCDSCPFDGKGPGLRLRNSLARGRWAEITNSLRQENWFPCHKTTHETGNGTDLVCAGALKWQEVRGLSSQYVRVCERLDYASKKQGTRT